MSQNQATSSDGQLAPAQPTDLRSLVPVSPGAVVSRTVVRARRGSITLFSFDQGQGLSEHSAPFDAFVQVLSGKVELTIGGEPVVAEAGEVVIMPAQVPHAVRALEPLQMLLVMIRDAD